MKRALLGAASVFGLFAIVSACSSGGSTNGGYSGSGGGYGNDGSAGGSGGSGGSTWPTPGSICFLLNCDTDAECGDCTLGRTRCDVASHRCIACDPASGTGCGAGQSCAPTGTCVGAGASCPVDGAGNPQVDCAKDADCAACDASHQACDVASRRCVACSATNPSLCAPNEWCAPGGSCEARCPASCAADVDCSQCATGSLVAKACNANTHACAECSLTHPCTGGKVCSAQGKCIAPCGVSGMPKGSCAGDADCAGCGAGGEKCHVPLNGGTGRCGPAATGCSDLGKGAAALPPPFDAVTQTCSSDQDCKDTQAGVSLDVGKLLRDATGIGLIGDATLQYEMNACANVTAFGKSCGVCVPCKTDADCHPIDIDPLASQMLGPLGGLASKYLLTQLFGSSDHAINMYCEQVAGDYGVCLPCSDVGHACGVATTEGTQCTNDWQCSAGEICQSQKCVKYAVGCTDDADCSGAVCAWSGEGYCCRPGFPDGPVGSTCVSDAECTGGEVCSWNGHHFYCTTPLCN